MLVLLLAVLGMHALVPAGHMLAPSGAHGITVTLCPTTHPLARALPAQAGEAGAMDHAAMGHMPSSPGDDTPPAATRGDSSCAFSAIGFAALDADRPAFDVLLRDAVPPESATLPQFGIVEADRLRPPLRAPPFFA
ncbi:hypothetical protein OZN62_00575 [Aurantiacibacter sp. MUD11]|uniref:hypothetical protein n=1 Tax=Aurantiacibacter sp. MUD11 TaxID=3003265 RepID=UPI0022AA4595|nr:hypothetical protein [Aurantiacibacter sp. MUD11]WAT18104.1 hypothetical protein OZN62_00575 [Aurantiacibacter sp. MUD11]